MKIREATEHDIPEILRVLKASLGEVSSQKTEEVWKFKHIDNPFGKSLVLVAEENHKLIGVRAFMRWKWQLNDRIFSAFRAVDTATHPYHQGKGVFKKLTLTAIEVAKEQGDDFIFNTPNSQSKPGYLKMGWQEVNKIRIELLPANPLFWMKVKEINCKVEKQQQDSLALENIFQKRNNRLIKSKNLFTPVSSLFLAWRYENNPLQQYSVIATDKFYVAAYVKQHNFIRELRVVEKIYGDILGKKQLDSQISKWSKLYGVHIISSHPGKSNNLVRFTGKLGPVLTIKNLNVQEDLLTRFLNIENWSYRLGDLELF